ncbi:hypothetical protein VNO78_07365 [Psophocarpus tetragonolobus]|uniref:Uncharacterized protein n=1 Tax=Psophocarpus tetragonolobus TaxID=3891 RepID=A0AAN9XSP3_PSOTE
MKRKRRSNFTSTKHNVRTCLMLVGTNDKSTNDGKLSDSKSFEFSVVVDSEGKGKLSGDCTQQQKHGKRSKQNLDHAHVCSHEGHVVMSQAQPMVPPNTNYNILNVAYDILNPTYGTIYGSPDAISIIWVERISRHSSPSKKLLAQKCYCFWLPHPTIKEPKDARGKAVMVIEDEIMHILVAKVMKKCLTISPTHCEVFIIELAGKELMKKSLTISPTHCEIFVTELAGRASILRVLQALSSLVTLLSEKEKDRVDEKNMAFVKFPEKHRTLLNAFIRKNPGWLEKFFSIMLKVPRFIDFDNKRAHFQ